MGAPRLPLPRNDLEKLILDKLGSVPLPQSEWLAQTQRYQDLGLVSSEFALQIFATISWFGESKRKPIYASTKRFFDLVAGLILATLLLPVYICCALAVKLESPGPVFFHQLRIGHLGKPFYIWKFRTMYDGSPAYIGTVTSHSKNGFFKAKLDPRITRAGRVLRRWSLDELPQILNVIRGDMSLVGPRPLPVYDSLAIPYDHALRYAVPPGLTGLWQVTARDSTDAAKNMAIDDQYIRERCWTLDFKILCATPRTVISGIGAV